MWGERSRGQSTREADSLGMRSHRESLYEIRLNSVSGNGASSCSFFVSRLLYGCGSLLVQLKGTRQRACPGDPQ